MLPSCTFRWGQRHTVPETCSACAHTGSQSTDTSTTTRYHGQNTHTNTYCTLMFPIVDTSPGAEGQRFPVRLCLYLSFTTACCELISLMCLRVQGYNESLHQFLLNTLCACWYWNRVQLQGFPLCFRFPVQNVQSVQVQESTKIGDARVDAAQCPVLCVLSVIDFCMCVSLATRHLYLLQPMVRSLTYEWTAPWRLGKSLTCCYTSLG